MNQLSTNEQTSPTNVEPQQATKDSRLWTFSLHPHLKVLPQKVQYFEQSLQIPKIGKTRHQPVHADQLTSRLNQHQLLKDNV